MNSFDTITEELNGEVPAIEISKMAAMEGKGYRKYAAFEVIQKSDPVIVETKYSVWDQDKNETPFRIKIYSNYDVVCYWGYDWNLTNTERQVDIFKYLLKNGFIDVV